MTQMCMFCCYYYHYQAESRKVLMKLRSTQSRRDVIDITNTVKKLHSLIPASNSLSEFDTVSMCHRTRCLKLYKEASVALVYWVTWMKQQSSNNVHAIALQKIEAHIKSRLDKTGRKLTPKVPQLCTLPPTVKAFEENVKRAHYQCTLRRNTHQKPSQLQVWMV